MDRLPPSGNSEPDPSLLEQVQLSRRTLLAMFGFSAAAAFLAGCETPSAHVVSDLPDSPGALRPGMALVPDPTPYAPSVPPTYSKPIQPVPQVQDSFGIIPRSSWTREGPNLRTIDPMNGVRLITFHHSGDPKPFTINDFAGTAQHLEYVRSYHRSRNFQDIGYHFAIDRAGRVWQLRSLRYQGQHVRYNNEHNIGVVVLGNFDMQSPTREQKDRIRVFGALLRKQYNLPISRVYTHQEIVKTECPGGAMQPYMVQIRRQGLI